ncbi:hypothetical protein [Bradyrhizobium sp. 150]|uniref:hypothetical protein n=1 Tax=Bradyrhizobium sp. 150 TaxID=2782625 RepID=UPI001FFA0FEF|nr:hypothetical protein [Bradyrhizobium sp. 150]MCK1670315.1 hypothetical protein [Bradyrhizobium sp. 150]
MPISVTQIPDDLACNATITYVPDTAKNTSESGVSSRKLLRPLLRNYLITVSWDYADEMQAIIMTTGTRYPLALRDPVANELVEEPALIADDGLTAMIGKTWAPATGSRTVFERVLIVDGSAVIKINGAPAGGAAVLGDYGVITLSPALDPNSDEVTVTCDYLRAVCMMDAPAATAFAPRQYQFHDIRLEQIFAAEFIQLTS